MAEIDVSTELEAIMEAIYGEQVRGSIHDAIQKMATVIRERVVDVDETLTVHGAAADAKTVGDKSMIFRGLVPKNSDLNDILSNGTHRLMKNGEYVHSPLSGPSEGWLKVYGNTTMGYTQEVVDFGTDASKTYYSWTRHCNTSGPTFVWGGWQKVRSETDPDLILEGVPADAKVVGETTLRFHGVLDDHVDFNSVWNSGIYRISSAKQYVNSPLENSKTGWLLVFQYGTTGISITQHVFESGINAKKTYLTYMRSANTTNYPYTWGEWQTSTVETDETLSKSGEAADAKVVGDRFLDLEYEPIDIYSFTCNPNVAEVGSTITSVELSYKVNKLAEYLAIDGTAITPALEADEVKSGLSLTTNKTFTITGRDSGSPNNPKHTDTMTATLSFKRKQYWGAAAQQASVTSEFVRGLSGAAFINGNSRSFTVTAGTNNYIWFASPAENGNCNFNVGGFDGGFTRVATINVTNEAGATASYYVYKSDNANLGSTTVTVRW